METLIVAVVSLCALLIVGARFVSGLRVLAWLASALLVTVSAQIIWWILLYFHILNVDAALGAVAFFGPPIAVGAAYAVFVARRARI